MKTDRSDIADKQWITGLKPAFSNPSKVITIFKKVKFTASNAPKRCLAKPQLLTVARLRANLVLELKFQDFKDRPTVLNMVL